jgi:hypothetical protein
MKRTTKKKDVFSFEAGDHFDNKKLAIDKPILSGESNAPVLNVGKSMDIILPSIEN